MKEHGYSLVEMVLVIAVIAILLAIGTLKFQDYAQRSRVEAQTRLIYSELQKARSNAIYQRRQTRVKLYPKRFEVYSSQVDVGAQPVVNQGLSYPITWNNRDIIDFDQNGVTTDWCSICVDGTVIGRVDSVVIDYIKSSIGKKDKGSDCNSDNITIR